LYATGHQADRLFPQVLPRLRPILLSSSF